MSSAALVDGDDIVVNVVEIGDDPWTPPDGLTLVAVTAATGPASIGATWDGTTFTPAPVPPAPNTINLREINNYAAMQTRRMNSASAAGDYATAFAILRELTGA